MIVCNSQYTLSGRTAGSIESNSASASEYASVSTNSSICSPQGFIWKVHIELPSLIAAVRSVGVVTRYRGDFAPGDEVNKRGDTLVTAVLASTFNGKGRDCEGTRDIDDRI